MNRTIISHDPVTTQCRVKFEHNDVVFEDNFLLNMVVPGTKQVFDALGIEFTEQHQMTVLDQLTARVQQNIEDGVIVNLPPIAQHAEPGEAPEPPVPDEEQPVPVEGA